MIAGIDPGAGGAIAWLNDAGALLADDKEVCRARALQLWPDHAARFARKMDADRAEAALIGLHGIRNAQQVAV